MFLESTAEEMHDLMTVATSRNVTMTSIMVRYILKALEIKFVATLTGHNCRILVILADDYLVITFGYLLQENELLWVDVDCL